MPNPSNYFKACKICTDERSLTCKATCARYKKERAAYETARMEEKKAKNTRDILGSYEAKNVRRAKRHRGIKTL